MRYSQIPNKLFIKNRKKLIDKITDEGIVIINSNDQMPRNGDQFFKYRQNSDFFYLTGIEQEKSILIINPFAKKKGDKEVLFIIKASKNLEIWEGHKLTKKEAGKISGIKNVRFISEFEDFLKDLLLGINVIFLNNNEYSKFDTPVPYKDIRFIKELKSKYPLHSFKRLAPVLTRLRLQKEPEEIELMQKACDITSNAFLKVLKMIKPGIKEYEIEAEITKEFIKKGANGHAYEPIIASGKNNCVLHYVSNDKICKDGDLILMDFGAEYANYSADTTRTVPVNGKFSKRQQEVYEAVLRVMRKATKLMVQGTTINKLNEIVNKYIEEELVSLNLANEKDIKNKDKKDTVRMKYFMHGTSHFMGLDVHDVGSKDTIFKPGMVLSCEPGIYIEEEGFGIRLENDILITDNEPVDLLANEPIEPNEIEELMMQKAGN
ncbi:MAG: aminopeptidase P N-terminal domain-containing protein [Bacteroidales bacterium]|nr:aminopeptidase P N-terminal domain-containing protein [Bacteroidales bacterium]